MVVNPRELIDRFNEDQKKILEKLEQEIDAKLLQDWVPGKPIDVHAPWGLSDKVKNEIKRRYEAVGWEVHYDSNCDQFDQYAYFRFTAPAVERGTPWRD
jgi:hypothetical protein